MGLVLMVLVAFIFTALLASRTTHPMNESGTFFTKMKIQCINRQGDSERDAALILTNQSMR